MIGPAQLGGRVCVWRGVDYVCVGRGVRRVCEGECGGVLGVEPWCVTEEATQRGGKPHLCQCV